MMVFRPTFMLLSVASRVAYNYAALMSHFTSRADFTKYPLDRLLQQSSVSKIAFLRHGNTAPSLTVDFDRVLTPLGKSQSMDAGKKFGKQLCWPLHHNIYSSPAPRACETAKLFLASTKQAFSGPVFTGSMKDNHEIKCIQKLYDGTMQPEGSELFKKHGYAPLGQYLKDEDDTIVAQKILGDYAYDVVDVIRKEFEYATRNHSERGTTLLIVGHAIYLPAAALGMALETNICSYQRLDDANQNKNIDLLMDTNTKEAEGYLLNIEQKSVTLLCRD